MLNEETKRKLDDLVNKDSDENTNIKRINRKKDGLIERINSSKKILTEDNKFLLLG
jgi:hypothetical protein